MTRVFVAQPAYGAGCFERESYDAPTFEDDCEVFTLPYESSLLANGFNKCVCACIGIDEFDEFLLLHGDVIPTRGFIRTLIEERDKHGFDAIHAACAIKDGRGLTSTALAYSSDPWEKKRRLTTRELHEKLPETFSIDEARDIDPSAVALLPNTGCLLISARARWFVEAFPGFEIRDRIDRSGEKPVARVVPEDWNFGYWMAAQGLRVGATRKVATRHVGKVPFMTEIPWGISYDEQYFESDEEVVEKELTRRKTREAA
jgi:hypothetical protein